MYHHTGLVLFLLHRMDDGTDKPNAFSSHTLAPAEKSILRLRKVLQSFLESRESTSIYHIWYTIHYIVWPRSIETFIQWVTGNSDYGISSYSAVVIAIGSLWLHDRVQPGQEHGNADTLSRLPLPETPAKVPVPSETILLLYMLKSQSQLQ